MTIDFQKVADAIEKASQETKDLMFSAELGNKLEEIAETNKLEEEVYLQMVDEVGYIILGLKSKSSFSDSLTEIGVEKSLATSISSEISRDIFSRLNNTNNVEPNKPVPNGKNEELAKKTRGAIRDKIKENLPELVRSLSQAKQNFVFNGIWTERTDEIAKKYSLNETQTDSLINNVLFVLIGTTTHDNFLETIIAELGISRLLAEQIVDDLDVRVFDYTFKSIEKKMGDGDLTTTGNQNKENVPVTAPKVENPPEAEEEIPEIRPEITPMVEKDEVVHNVEPEQKISNFQSPISNQTQNSNGAGSPATMEVRPPQIDKKQEEPIPRPSASSLRESAGSNQEPPKPPEPVSPPPKNYAVDPYREPLE